MASWSLTAPPQIYPIFHSKIFSLPLSKLSTSAFNVSFTPPPPSSSLTVTATHRRNSSTPSVSSKTTNKKKKATRKSAQEDEDAFEALFSQLEEDLKNDGLYGDENEDDDDISDEELAKLEQELAEALEHDDIFGDLVSATHGEANNEDDAIIDGEDGYGVDDDNEGEERPIKLKNWQLRRLAYALKDGRRKTRIKNLAADLCLDRDVVLRLLRDPPPNLVMLSSTLPDKPVSTIMDPVQKVESVPLDTETETTKPETKAKTPVHVMCSNWSAEKRLKKVQLQTLEKVYARTKRPTNAMISSIVHVTNLPRKRVVKWFEDRRSEDGVPERRLPYQGSVDKPVFSG